MTDTMMENSSPFHPEEIKIAKNMVAAMTEYRNQKIYRKNMALNHKKTIIMSTCLNLTVIAYAVSRHISITFKGDHGVIHTIHPYAFPAMLLIFIFFAIFTMNFIMNFIKSKKHEHDELRASKMLFTANIILVGICLFFL